MASDKGRFGRWAERGRPSPPLHQARPIAPAQAAASFAPPAQPPQLQVYAQVQQFQGHPQPIVVVKPQTPQRLYIPRQSDPVDTCVIVKRGDRDPWAETLQHLPELTGTVVPDYVDGYNAMTAADVPDGADMRPADANLEKKFNSSTGKPTFGSGDMKRGMVRDYIQKRYGVSVGQIRNTDGMQVVEVTHKVR